MGISDANLNAPPVSGGELRNEKRYSIADMKSRLADQSDEDKLNPLQLLFVAVILGCCLFCPFKNSSSSQIQFFDYVMLTTSILILAVLTLFIMLTFRYFK